MMKETSQHIKKRVFNPLYFQKSLCSEEERIKKEEQRLIARHRPERIRIFKNDLLERMTLVQWQTIFLVWVPFVCYQYYLSFTNFKLTGPTYLVIGIAGMLTWSLAEYLIHRFPFHLKPTSSWARKIVYSMHGNHHDDPFDPLRGVMPILPAMFYISLLYGLFTIIIPIMYFHAFFASFIIGYLLYDGIHYYTHHGKPKNKLGRYLRKIHLIHHVHDDVMYGISSPLWDLVFGTYKKQGYQAPKEF